MAAVAADHRITLTRRGKPVAVLISIETYQQYVPRQPQGDFWDAYQAWRRENPDLDIDAELDFIESLRDCSPGHELNLFDE